jgi:hypothetical protein
MNNKGVETIEIQDKYNSDKIWVVKVTSCNHYYYNQKINKKLFYRKFSKTTKKFLISIGLNID